MCVLPAACAETQLALQTAKRVADSQEPSVRGTYKVGTPYQINGIWYYPHEDYHYREVGVGSWYGNDFHGKRTGNGEIYDMNALTAAHRTLPMPSLVRVTNTANGRSVVVRVNDRGPFANDRIIDMSRRAAQLLGFETQGTSRVQVDILAEESIALKNELLRNTPEDEPKIESAPRVAVATESLAPLAMTSEPVASKPPAVHLIPERSAVPISHVATSTRGVDKASVADHVAKASAESGIFVQAATFSNESNAKRFASRLSKFGPTQVSESHARNGVLYRVRVGPLKSKKAAEGAMLKLRNEGFRDSRVVIVN